MPLDATTVSATTTTAATAADQATTGWFPFRRNRKKHTSRNNEDSNGSNSNNNTNSVDLEASPPAPTGTGKLTTLNTLALCVSLQIGAGIFAAPSQIAQFAPSPFLGVLVWFLGGLFVWTGAATFVELGVLIPRNGGVQEYLRVCFSDGAGGSGSGLGDGGVGSSGGMGEMLGFVFTVTWCILTKPASMGIISLVFSEYLLSAFRIGEQVDGSGDPAPLDPWLIKGVGFLGLLGLTTLNCLGAKTGATAANIFFFIKVAALLSIIALGFCSPLVGEAHGVPESPGGWFGVDSEFEGLGWWEKLGRMVTGLFGVLYVYGGWESIGFYLGDVKEPTKTLPRAMSMAMVLCISGFFFMSAALYVALPMDVIRENKAVAVELGQRMLSTPGIFLYSLLVSISSLGSMNSNIFATGRLVASASTHSIFPPILGNRHCLYGDSESEYYAHHLSLLPRPLRWPIIEFASLTERLRLQLDVPVYAMLFNLLFSSGYLLLGTFNRLITFVGMSEYFFWFLCTIGLFHLRRRKLEVPASQDNLLEVRAAIRPYRTWIWNPVIFLFLSGLVVFRGMVSDPWQAVGIFGCMGGGWLLWLLKQRTEGRGRENGGAVYSPLLNNGGI